MKTFIIIIIGVFCVLISDALLHAGLVDYTENEVMFFDSQSGLYWYDPGTFAGWSIDEVDAFIDENPLWKWADADRVMELSLSMDGCDTELLVGIMGTGTYSTGSSCGWIGYIDQEEVYVAAGVGSISGSAFIELYASLEDDQEGGGLNSIPVISGTVLHGAWLYAEDDPMDYTAPVPEPSTIFLIGTGLMGLAGVLRKFGRK